MQREFKHNPAQHIYWSGGGTPGRTGIATASLRQVLLFCVNGRHRSALVAAMIVYAFIADIRLALEWVASRRSLWPAYSLCGVGWGGFNRLVEEGVGRSGLGRGVVGWGWVGWGGVGGRVGLGWGGVKSTNTSSHPMGPVHHILYVQHVYIVLFVCMQLCTYSTYSVCVEYLCVNVCV